MATSKQKFDHNVSQTKDFEFSRATVNDHWRAGLEDIRCAAAHQDWLNLPYARRAWPFMT